MALSGLHVSFHSSSTARRPEKAAPLQIYGEVLAAETLASAGTSTVAAPTSEVSFARVLSSADAWVTFGATPADPSVSSSSRVYVQALTPIDVFVRPGDLFRWSAA